MSPLVVPTPVPVSGGLFIPVRAKESQGRSVMWRLLQENAGMLVFAPAMESGLPAILEPTTGRKLKQVGARQWAVLHANHGSGQNSQGVGCQGMLPSPLFIRGGLGVPAIHSWGPGCLRMCAKAISAKMPRCWLSYVMQCMVR